MRGKSLKVAVATTAIALFATACSSDSGETTENDSGGELRIYASEPAFLLPSAGDDEPSILVIRQLYRGLVKYNAETGEPENDLAESIESEDNQTWTIKVKDGYTFDNGEPVNADAFIRAWNFTAYGPNAQNNSYFMKRIAGIDEVTAGEDPDGDGPQEAPEPVAQELSGLQKVDDMTFTVELKAPFSGFPAIVGYSGFFPMAEACIADSEACNETPIGNGPYKIEGSWQHDVGITLVRSDSWAGEDKGKADTLAYKIYQNVDAGYAAFQAGELDVMYTIPPARYAEAKQQYGEQMYEAPGDSFTYVGMPLYNENFQDKRVRQAFSLAIDRQGIIDAVFNGRFTPAEGVVAPTFDGYRPGVCEYCTQDIERAKQLLAEAGGWQGGPLELWANAGAGHEAWLQAVGDQIKAALGIEYELKVNLQFPEYLSTADQKAFTGPFRLGWGPDYPVIETYLQPLYGTGSGSNNSTYSNQEFDALIAQGDAAENLEAAIPFYNQAEDLVVEDLPVIPMWFSKVAALYGENVDQFVWNKISDAEYGKITLKSNS
ncbi:ABC transporter substrate-binding protein [Solwaraspora sp. WMMA2056]|uniref:peptide ABC transporter substrate-binding protein n=1 Tax=Solwaraspora sp. WMMA2056 TaxID=3015161 RepID=UPI00259B0037|nr:ABC transporter substrate-binding protein [Solwaraspora sp. WMMA2056]WJK42384.1 ABC transporter substrate-binding protein [Solwaraspora sp. WMMA2056]